MVKVNKDLYEKFKNPDITLENNFFDGKRNKTFMFLLPLTKINFPKCQDYFINCYADDINKLADLNGCIYLLFKFNKETHKYLKSCQKYVYSYFVGHNGLVKYYMYCFSVNCDDYEKVIDGKYSKTSSYYKELLSSFVYDRDKDNSSIPLSDKTNFKFSETVKGVVYKKEWLRKQLNEKLDEKFSPDQEYWETFYASIDREIYNSNLNLKLYGEK